MKYPLVAVIFLVTGSASSLLLLQSEESSLFRPWNQAFLDKLVATTAPETAPMKLLTRSKLVSKGATHRRNEAGVTFLRIRPADFEKGKLNPRLDWAILLNSLLKFKPRAAGIVPPLRWDDRDVLTEGALAKQVKQMPPMVLGAILSPSQPGAAQPNLAASFSSLDRITGDRSHLLQASQVAAMPDDELLINGKPGFTHIELQKELSGGPNGLRFPLICRLGDRVVPSFPLQLVMSREGLLPDDVQIQLDGPRPQIQIGDKHSIPVDSTGCLAIHPSLTRAFPLIDFASLALAASDFQDVAAQLRDATKDDLDSLGKNTVAIGFDDESLQEFPLPSGEKVSRAHLLSMAVAAIQSGFVVTSWPKGVRLLFLLSLLIIGMLVLTLPRWLSACAGLFAGVAYLGMTWFLFQQSLVWAPPWPALMLCLVMSAVGAALPRKNRKRKWF